MTVYVFIIESAGTESYEHVFSGTELENVGDKNFEHGMNLDNIEEMISNVSTKFQDDTEILFVDKMYVTTYFYTEKGKKYYENIKELKTQHKFYNGTWMEFFEKFIGIDDTSNYIFTTMKDYVNVYDFTNLLQISLKNNCYFSWGVKNVNEIVNSKSYYNIFSKTPRLQQVDTLGNHQFEDINAINWIVENGVKQVLGMMECGIHRNEKFMQSFVEPWITNPASYFSKGIIVEYEMKPESILSESRTIMLGYLYNELFNTSAEYRYQLLDGMCRTLIKYGFEFKKLEGLHGSIFNVQFNKLL